MSVMKFSGNHLTPKCTGISQFSHNLRGKTNAQNYNMKRALAVMFCVFLYSLSLAREAPRQGTVKCSYASR